MPEFWGQEPEFQGWDLEFWGSVLSSQCQCLSSGVQSLGSGAGARNLIQLLCEMGSFPTVQAHRMEPVTCRTMACLRDPQPEPWSSSLVSMPA